MLYHLWHVALPLNTNYMNSLTQIDLILQDPNTATTQKLPANFFELLLKSLEETLPDLTRTQAQDLLSIMQGVVVGLAAANNKELLNYMADGDLARRKAGGPVTPQNLLLSKIVKSQLGLLERNSALRN